MNFDIHRLTPHNTDLLERVAEEVFDEPVRADRLAAYVAEPGHLLLLGLAQGEVIAQVAAVIHRHPDKPTELYIDEVGVTPAFHRQGVATRMLEEMFAIGRSLGCKEAWVGTEPDNEAAGALYRRFGAEPQAIVMYEYEI